MKTLYLHCGAHKTGSSFLQTLFSRNREFLQKSGIHYPVSNAEYDMQMGNISPGNGKDLSSNLREKGLSEVLNILRNGVKEAENRECHSLLYSAESLFHTFVKDEKVERIYEAAQSAGFTSVKALVYLRDPVSHALSTYKHRAKRGDHPDFRLWVRSKYETMDLLQALNRYYNQFPVEWSCRLYRPDSEFMAQSSFGDWLKTTVPPIPADDRVNRSLSLNEIRLLQILKTADPKVIPFLQDEFSRLDINQKNRDDEIEYRYKKVAFEELKKHLSLLHEINKLMPEGEELGLAEKLSCNNATDADIQESVSLSPAQAEALMNGIKCSIESEKLINSLKELWRRGLRKVKRKYKAAGA